MDLACIKPRMDVKINMLKYLQTHDGPASKRLTTSSEFGITASKEQKMLVGQVEVQFLDKLIGNIQARHENHDIIDNTSVFAMSNTDALAGYDDIEDSAEHYGCAIDQALFE